jgi:protocatechuate 3,4-dioxygenase beta subunit
MTRPALAAVVVVTLAVAPLGYAQDTEFIRALETAQRGRPAQLSSTARIAAAGEPGTPLVIHGRAVAEDGRTPLANAIVFAYHTDRAGLYDRAGAPPHSWRLKGWAKTDADGRFEFATIRPGAYPNTTIKAHVHFTLFTADGSRYHAGELQFEGDRGIRREGATEHVEFTARAEPRQRF